MFFKHAIYHHLSNIRPPLHMAASYYERDSMHGQVALQYYMLTKTTGQMNSESELHLFKQYV